MQCAVCRRLICVRPAGPPAVEPLGHWSICMLVAHHRSHLRLRARKRGDPEVSQMPSDLLCPGLAPFAPLLLPPRPPVLLLPPVPPPPPPLPAGGSLLLRLPLSSVAPVATSTWTNQRISTNAAQLTRACHVASTRRIAAPRSAAASRTRLAPNSAPYVGGRSARKRPLSRRCSRALLPAGQRCRPVGVRLVRPGQLPQRRPTAAAVALVPVRLVRPGQPLRRPPPACSSSGTGTECKPCKPRPCAPHRDHRDPPQLCSPTTTSLTSNRAIFRPDRSQRHPGQRHRAAQPVLCLQWTRNVFVMLGGV